MDVKEYIGSGILESYCMGTLSAEEKSAVEMMCMLYPEIKEELNSIEMVLEKYAETNAIEPNPDFEEKIIASLYNLDEENTGDIHNLPLINKYSDYVTWLSLVGHLIPPNLTGDRVITPLQQTEAVVQMLLISSSDFEEEVHVNELESFLILDGKCECTVGDDIFTLEAGGFAEIPLYTPHSVKVLSSSVTAILQRLTV